MSSIKFLNFDFKHVDLYIIIIEEIKNILIAKSVTCPGIIAMVVNLFKSFDFQNDSKLSPGQLEYWQGLTYEIYIVSTSLYFENMNFSEVAYLIYNKFNAILLGIQL